jgi:hypothetical protein
MTEHPLCRECNKEIWGISHIKFIIGSELPTLLHTVCYERLKEFESKYMGLCK